MFKTRFISMLVLLMTAVTGAWADTTVTWEGTKLQSIAVSKGYNTNVTTESMTVDGITITANKGYLKNDDREGVMFLSGADNGVVFSAENNIKSITITSTGFSEFTDGDFQIGGSHTYEVSPAATSYGFANGVSIWGITKIEITLEGAPTVAVTGVTLAPTSATLTLGETETVTLTATVLPGDATDKSVTWSSSDEAVATVTDGVVTAVAAGTATITVTTTDGAKTATCAVTVAAPAASTYTVTLKDGTEDATSWTIAPDEATTTGVAAGTEVKATYGGAKKVKSVKAKKKAPANVAVTSITLNKTATEITVGQTETLSVTSVLPEEATDKTYTWKTSDETKATVDQDGKVTAVAAGTVTIYAEANDGSGVKGNCAVTVTPAAAEGHALSASAVGEIVGSDGKAYAVADKDNLPSGVTAVAMVAYKSATTGNSLAIALADEGAMNWNSAKSTCGGKAAIGGKSWKLPSQAEWKQMFSANGGSDASYTGLKNALAAAGGNSSKLQEDQYYWSSTLADGGWVWELELDNGDANWYDESPSNNDVRVRACLAF